jgi:hypothetical protein
MRGGDTEREEKLPDRGGKGRTERKGSLTQPGGEGGKPRQIRGRDRILRKGERGKKSEGGTLSFLFIFNSGRSPPR